MPVFFACASACLRVMVSLCASVCMFVFVDGCAEDRGTGSHAV